MFFVKDEYKAKLEIENRKLKSENQALKSRLAAESVLASVDLLNHVKKANPSGDAEIRLSLDNEYKIGFSVVFTGGRFGAPTYTEKHIDELSIKWASGSEIKSIEQRTIREMMKQFHKFIKGDE